MRRFLQQLEAVAAARDDRAAGELEGARPASNEMHSESTNPFVFSGFLLGRKSFRPRGKPPHLGCGGFCSSWKQSLRQETTAQRGSSRGQGPPRMRCTPKAQTHLCFRVFSSAENPFGRGENRRILDAAVFARYSRSIGFRPAPSVRADAPSRRRRPARLPRPAGRKRSRPAGCSAPSRRRTGAARR